MARVEVGIDCSPNEFRRFFGQPDLLPLNELVALALERYLVHKVAAIDLPCEGAAESSDRRQEAGRAGS